MAKSKQTSLKREKEKNRQRKQKEKETRRLERKNNSNKGKGLDAVVFIDKYSDSSAGNNLVEIHAGISAEKKAVVSGEGRVAYYNEQKGYGFIKDSITKGTIYFLSASLPAPVKVNDMLSYSVIKGPKGATADTIRLA